MSSVVVNHQNAPDPQKLHGLLREVEAMRHADLLYLVRLLDRKRKKVHQLALIQNNPALRWKVLHFDAVLAQVLMLALVSHHGLKLPEADQDTAVFVAKSAFDPAFYDEAYRQAIAKAAERIIRNPKDFWLLNANPQMPSYNVDASIVADIAQQLGAERLQRVMDQLSSAIS
jgi:nicotinic acid phosphoribosyltransferase